MMLSNFIVENNQKWTKHNFYVDKILNEEDIILLKVDIIFDDFSKFYR